MLRKKMSMPRQGLSLAHIDAEARNVDWSELRGECDDGFEIQLPSATYGDWAEHDMDAPAAVQRIAKRSAGRQLSEKHEEAFGQTDAYLEWRDTFEPMMNYAWPVSLAYQRSPDEAIASMAEHARACVLIELSEEASERLHGYGPDAPEYVIALTGGGMDLSDELAADYLACGCVPPSRILSGLAGVISRDKARRLPLREAYRAAASAYATRAKQMREESKRIHAEPRK